MSIHGYDRDESLDAFATDRLYAWGVVEPVKTVKRCLHANTAPVKSVTAEVVARLCLTCDTQLDSDGA